VKKYTDSNYGMNYKCQHKAGNRKAKIRRCPVCKLYFDCGGTYPRYFVYYGAPEEVCSKCKDE